VHRLRLSAAEEAEVMQESRLDELRPDQVLQPGHVEEYEKCMHLLQSELALLNADLYIAEKLESFPSSLFLGRGRDDFFRIVWLNCLQSATLIVSRLFVDKRKPDRLRMQRVREMIAQWIRPEYRAEFEQRCVRLDSAPLSASIKAVKSVRDSTLAHLLVVDGTLMLPPGLRLALPDLKKMRDHLVAYLDALSFGTEYSTWLLQYSPNLGPGPGTPSDVEQVLDAFVKNSSLFNSPETRPNSWRLLKKGLGAEDLKHLNEYRRRLGFPEV